MESGRDCAQGHVTFQIEHLQVEVSDGIRFHVARAGSGPPVVLLHGFTGSTETWRELQEFLAESFTTIAVDITGHGLSDSPAVAERYSLKQFAHDLSEILDRLGIARAVVLGYSMGGRAALRFAVQYPERVAGLVLESTSPGISDTALRRERIAADDARAAMIEAHGVRAFVDDWEQLPLWRSVASVAAPVREALRTQRLANTAVGLANSLRGAGAGHDEHLFESDYDIRTTVLLVVGELDTRYVEFARLMAERIPGPRCAVVEDAGHMVHLEKPARFRQLVRSWLDELPRAGGEWR
jgi:2-succinyl-6-hydroxy-2,4-cyclohexadiene-1-carboxylate synthase